MKREYSKEENKLIKFLREHNCIFYSPLSQDDTSDWISGNQMVKFANDSAVWDSTLNMWKFQYVTGQQYGTNPYFAKWTLKNVIPQNSALIFSGAAEFYPYDSQQPGTDYTHANWDLIPTRSGFSMYASPNTLTNSCQTFKTVNNVTVQYQYMNGVNQTVYTYGQIITFNANKSEITIGQYENSYFQKQYGMRNFALFANGFSTQEIDEYFSLI